MYDIIKKLYPSSRDQLIKDILNQYRKKRTSIISYIYGATMVKYDLLWQWKSFVWHNIKNILLDADFLLPDGVAIRTMYYIGRLKKLRWWEKTLHNLNGTDFLPYFLTYLHNNNFTVNCVTLTVYDTRIGNKKWYLKQWAIHYISTHRPNFTLYGEEIEYSDMHYDQFDRWNIEHFLIQQQWQYVKNSKEDDGKTISLLLNFRGWSYGAPHQELFSFINRNTLQKLNLLCMNQGATVDFWTGREKRAPQWIRTLRLESVYRLLSDPKKNRKKFLISFQMIRLIISRIITQQKK